MRSASTLPLDEFLVSRSGSVNPAKFQDESFDLYSIPAFEKGLPDVMIGRGIGSTKQTVQSGDVLLSKIVPHIRRAWVVGKYRGRRMIASGEWIVFRSPKIYSTYLRYLLVEDSFHAKFMQTVSGVGGSLLRARPAQVAEIRVAVPPLPEQKRIATLLEKADRLRRTRRYTRQLSDTFFQSVFLEMFGDLASNTGGWDTALFGDLIVGGPQNGIYKPASAYGSGTPILRIDAFYDGVVTDINKLKRVRINQREMNLYSLRENDFVINRVNSRSHLGKSAVIPALREPTVFESNMMRLRTDSDRVHPIYMLQFLQTPFLNQQIQGAGKDAVNQASINQQDVESFQIRVPPLPLQQKFANIVRRFERLRAQQREAERQVEHLFQTLLHRAFALSE